MLIFLLKREYGSRLKNIYINDILFTGEIYPGGEEVLKNPTFGKGREQGESSRFNFCFSL